MFEFDAGKLIIIGIVALIVIGPKELPRVMRHAGEALAKMRRMGAEFRSQLLEAMREAEFDDIKSGVENIAARSKPDFGVDPLAQIKAEITQALEAAEKPGAAPETGAALLAAPPEGQASSQHSLTARTTAALPGSEDPNFVESSDMATANLKETAAHGAIDQGFPALAGALAAESGAAAAAPRDARLEKAPDHG
jgi:sec-independent protein translocase protein TatB